MNPQLLATILSLIISLLKSRESIYIHTNFLNSPDIFLEPIANFRVFSKEYHFVSYLDTYHIFNSHYQETKTYNQFLNYCINTPKQIIATQKIKK